MLVDHQRHRRDDTHHTVPPGAYGPDSARPRDSALRRFLGGSPAGVVARLLPPESSAPDVVSPSCRCSA